ncbi:hypothetical protein CDCA_CDCA12G3349 [Cyanidium caldarium]|uniref:Phospholipid/glycerol acyltransferase domain-containing protein n=1 Tax=Cyanidium caldarium TaxID=2771 RepID=A0AAV9IYG8_CYACA|nr:hypothetical protein CDCA_CDCA12G3349 [Cyanidium caldarium]
MWETLWRRCYDLGRRALESPTTTAVLLGMQLALRNPGLRRLIGVLVLRLLSMAFMLWLLVFNSLGCDLLLPLTIYNPPLLLLAALGVRLLRWRQPQSAETLMQTARRVRSAVRSFFLRLWVDALVSWAETVGGLDLIVTGDDIVPSEACVVLCNHQSWVDSLIIFCLASTAGRSGDFRFLAKRSLLYLPIIGTAAKFTGGSLFIRRKYEQDAGRMQRTYRQLLTRRQPFWFTIFAEGTRLNSRSKLAEAKRYYREVTRKQTAAVDGSDNANTTTTAHPLPLVEPRYCLVPRVKGFQRAVAGLRDRIGAVYDLTIFYENLADETPNRAGEWVPRPTVADMYLWATRWVRAERYRVHVHVRRTPVAALPDTEDGLARWMFANYADKERLLQRAHAQCAFRGERAASRQPPTWRALLLALLQLTAVNVSMAWLLRTLWVWARRTLHPSVALS